MKRMLVTIVTGAGLLLTLSSLSAADVPGATDHPMLKRIEGSEIIWYKFSKFDELNIPLAKVEFDYDTTKFKETKREKVEGAHTVLYYKLPGDVATLEAVRQYEEELKPAGFETLFTAANDQLDDGYNRFVSQTFPTVKKTPGLQYVHEFNHDEQRYMALKGPGKEGGEVYVTLYAFVLKDVSSGFDELKKRHQYEKGQTLVRVDILETKPMEARMTVVQAEEITKTISTSGRIAIYGVHFDIDKAEIKPDSAESLSEMAKAIKGGGGKYLIVGHTDNQGDLTHNQALSQKRAAAVTAALSGQYGIPAGNLIAVGVGMAAPVAPNTDEAGRAKNRRVEMVKM
ncbi:MAG TPA: OmpA family protein [Chthoniobacterales bacterium]|nr:OmpA family protein [Chthoniobacterales bacterium]